MRAMRAGFAVLVALAAACGAGCKRKRAPEPAAAHDGGSAAMAITPADAPPGDAAAAPAVDAGVASWELRSAPLELDCVTPPAVTGSFQSALDTGRAAGKATRWADAVRAFERALVTRDGDAVALDELAVAALQTGDVARALGVAERAILAGTTPNAQAASHYNAGRAAEALGDLSRARTHYERSIALRASPAVEARLGKLAAPAPRSLPRATPIAACPPGASVEAACECLAASAAWTAAAGLTGAPTCEAIEPRGVQAQVVMLRSGPPDPDATAGATVLVLVAKRGATWLPVVTVDAAPDVDLTETPNAIDTATVRGYAERDEPGHTLVWVESQHQSSETDAGTQEVSGDAGLTLCAIPTAPAEPVRCHARIPLAAWSYAMTPARGEGEDVCEVRSAVAYAASLAAAADLRLVLTLGTDATRRAGTYQR